MSEPRMWWLRKSSSGRGPRWNCTKDLTRYAGYKGIVPVIEYSAYQRLEAENAALKKHIIAVHETSIAWGKQGLDMFAHTGLREEYKEILKWEK